MPPSSAQRSSSSAGAAPPQKAASATANDLASARPPKYRFTSSSVIVSPAKSLASWSAAADSERRSWPTDCTRGRRVVRHPRAAAGTSAADEPASSERELLRLHLGDRVACAAWSTRRALLAAAVHQHQGDVLGRRRGVRQQAVDGLLRNLLDRPHHHCTAAREQRGLVSSASAPGPTSLAEISVRSAS